MHKRILIRIGILIGIIVASAAVTRFSHAPVPNPDPNHTHADFAVWINGKQFDFSDHKYMSEKPQALVPSLFLPVASAHGDDDGHDQLPGREYLHLHDGNGTVIHKHKPGLTIGNFFNSLGFSMTPTCFITDEGVATCDKDGKEWQMFVNGKKHAFDPAYDFADGDHLLLTYGADAAEVQRELALMTDDACRYSQTCPWKGKPPVENCIADPAVPCVEI